MKDKGGLEGLLRQAEDHPRKSVNYDMRTSPEDGSQRMLNAMMPGTVVEIHHHPRSDENMIAIWGKMEEMFIEILRMAVGKQVGLEYSDNNSVMFPLCDTRTILNSVPFDELNDSVNEPLADNVGCLDIDNPSKGHPSLCFLFSG